MVWMVNEYCTLQDWLDEQIRNGMNDLDPIARSVQNRQCKLLKMMNENERVEAVNYNRSEPDRYW